MRLLSTYQIRTLEVVPTDDPPAVEAPEPFGAFSLRAEAQKKVFGDLRELENHFRKEIDHGHDYDANQVRVNRCCHMREALIAFFRA